MMGPDKYRGIGGTRRGMNVPPTSPDSGSGGAGILHIGQTNNAAASGGGVSIRPALDEIGDVTTGRITLGLINLTILAMIGFYVWTRSAQGGG